MTNHKLENLNNLLKHYENLKQFIDCNPTIITQQCIDDMNFIGSILGIVPWYVSLTVNNIPQYKNNLSSYLNVCCELSSQHIDTHTQVNLHTQLLLVNNTVQIFAVLGMSCFGPMFPSNLK